jgi:RHS repeat-associated protein
MAMMLCVTEGIRIPQLPRDLRCRFRSYNDRMIMRDVDLSTDWDAEADALDTRHYYCQNWRADVSVIIDDTATIVERVMYSPYGVPFGIPAGDVANSSFGVPEDGNVDGFDNSVLLGAYSGSWNYCDLDNDGDVDADDTAIVTANTGNNLGWGLMSNHHNRFGYAGYVFDENLAGTKWHVRHRVLESVLGRWISRDPLGYVDGMSLNVLAQSNAVTHTDPTGLVCTTCNTSGQIPDEIPTPRPRGLEQENCGKRPPLGSALEPTYFACKCRNFWRREMKRGILWTYSLPDCPCKIPADFSNPNPDIWEDPGTGGLIHHYHEGAAVCMRSKGQSGKSCQQCCYDDSGQLITHGPGAGTPDLFCSGGLRHLDFDVFPWDDCAKGGLLPLYWDVRPPNQGNACSCNFLPPDPWDPVNCPCPVNP